MPVKPILTEYTRRALREATATCLADGSYVGRIPGFTGIIAFGETPEAVLQELAEIVPEWTRLGLEQGDELPVLGDIDFKDDRARELALYH